jgi:hypothetical protein
VQALASFGQARYGGPGPPPGPAHTYVFTIYALPEPSGISEDMATDEALELLQSAATADGAETAELRGEFETKS